MEETLKEILRQLKEINLKLSALPNSKQPMEIKGIVKGNELKMVIDRDKRNGFGPQC